MTLNDCKHGTIVKIGPTTYRVYRLEQFDNGVLGTMRNFAGVQKCKQREDGSWWDVHTVPRKYQHWHTSCELVDDSNTAVAGDVWDTRTGKRAVPLGDKYDPE